MLQNLAAQHARYSQKMSKLPLELVEEWMAFLDRETVDACVLLCRKFRAAYMKMTALRVVDTAHLREYDTVQNFNVTIAWTTVGRSRRGKSKTEVGKTRFLVRLFGDLSGKCQRVL